MLLGPICFFLSVQSGDTPLHNASFNLHNTMVEMLLKAGADPSAINQVTDYRKHVHIIVIMIIMLYTNQVCTVFMCFIKNFSG